METMIITLPYKLEENGDQIAPFGSCTIVVLRSLNSSAYIRTTAKLHVALLWRSLGSPFVSRKSRRTRISKGGPYAVKQPVSSTISGDLPHNSPLAVNTFPKSRARLKIFCPVDLGLNSCSFRELIRVFFRLALLLA